MVEIIDNISQCLVVAVFCCITLIKFYKTKSIPYFLLMCVYGTYTLGIIYWTLHDILYSETPPVFYVTELAWIASYVFIAVLIIALSTEEEKKFHTPLSLIIPLICVPQFILYLFWGDILLNVFMCGLTMIIGVLAVRGLMFVRKQGGSYMKKQGFFIALLVFVAAEYSLWTWSCFWISDTLTNPYFWSDFLLTGSLAAIYFTMKKAVRE